MRTQRTYLFAFLFLFLLGLFAPIATAGVNWDVYVSGRKPGNNEDPSNGQPPWTKVKSNANPAGGFTIKLGPNQRFWLGIPNSADTTHQKVLTIVISGAGSENLKADQAAGHYGTNNKKTTKGKIFKPNKKERNKYPGSKIIKIFYPKQPEWEWVRINNTGDGGEFTFTIDKAYTNCNRRGKRPEYHNFYVESGYFGGDTDMVGDMAITEIWNFPNSANVDAGTPATFIADPATGNWTADVVYADPDGEPKPQGGVRWISDGAGLTGGDVYSYEFAMLEDWENEYTVFVFDAENGEYYPSFAHTYPIIRQWQNVNAPFPLDLDIETETNGPDGPAVETRMGGIGTIEVEFDREVVLVDPAAITATDGSDIYTPATVSMYQNNTILAIDFTGVLPPTGCYTIELNGAIENLYGDDFCQVRSLIGDVSGDGIVNADDEVLMTDYLGMPVDEDLAKYDLDQNGIIDMLDMMLLTDHFEQFVFCADPPSAYMTADISGPEGYSDNYVDIHDFVELAAHWLECNDSLDAACDL